MTDVQEMIDASRYGLAQQAMQRAIKAASPSERWIAIPHEEWRGLLAALSENDSWQLGALGTEVVRQDEKHGAFKGSRLGRARLALACLEDEIDEALDAYRAERSTRWDNVRTEILQVAAVAMRALRDAFPEEPPLREGEVRGG